MYDLLHHRHRPIKIEHENMKNINLYPKLIGQFYLQKNNEDWEKAIDEITQLRITNMRIVDDKLEITSNRPGLIIGPKGSNINALEKYLKIQIMIKEEKHDWLYEMTWGLNPADLEL